MSSVPQNVKHARMIPIVQVAGRDIICWIQTVFYNAQLEHMSVMMVKAARIANWKIVGNAQLPRVQAV